MTFQKGEGIMIKGVNKRIVEINRTNDEYFDKAILFVSDGVGEVSPKQLSQHAENYLKKIGRRKNDTFKFFFTAIISSSSTLLLTAIIMLILL